jgi:hypothetical protein
MQKTHAIFSVRLWGNLWVAAAMLPHLREGTASLPNKNIVANTTADFLSDRFTAIKDNDPAVA